MRGGTRVQRKTQGFTLLELLMVVIIIAILASIALPQYMRVAERSRAAEALTILAAIRSSELRYKANDPGHAYTTDLNLLDVEVPGFQAAANSVNWQYSVLGNIAGSNAQALRKTTSKTVSIDLDAGTTCSDEGNLYGLTNGAC